MKTHQPCPDCGHNGCLTVFNDGNTYCHSCGTVHSQITSETQYSPADLTHKIVSYRGISKSSAEKYNILTGYSDDKEVTRVYPYPHALKTRMLPKDFSKNKGFTNDHLFGMDKFNPGCSKTITVVEGEEDTPSAYQMLGGQWPVVGAPSNSVKTALKNKEVYNFLDCFDQIVVVLDNDGGAGNKLGNDLARAFPNKTYAVNLTLFKDSNDYLVNNKAKEFLNAWLNRKKYTPDNILNTPDQFLSLYRDTPQQLYVPTGIEALDSMIKGIMRGYFTVLKARTGIGKTEVMRKLEYAMISQGEAIAVWHLEETKLRSLLGLVSYHIGDDVTRKDVIEEKGISDKVEEGIKDLTQGELLYQFYLRDGDSSSDLIDQIRYFAEVCDVKYIFIEPIQDIISGSGESKEAMLADLAVRLSKLAAELNIAIVTIAHTNDDGEIKYCRMIGQRAGIIINLERDKEASDESVRNTTWLTVEKNRPLSLEGHAGCLEFDPDTFIIEEKVYD